MKHTKRMMALLLAVVMVLTVLPTASAAGTYTDVKEGAWYYEAVEFVTQYGAMNGVGGNRFDPDARATRAMIVTVLYRSVENAEGTYTNQFSDVTAGQWYSDAIAWGVDSGVVEGYTDGTFKPNQSATREELALMFFRFAQYLSGMDTSDRADLSGYSDADKVSSWAKEAMEWAVGDSIVNGRSDTTLVPQGTSTRAELATMLMRLVYSYSLPLWGKTVVLHTNDVHGAIEGYATVAYMEDALEMMGAEVVLVDAGDFSQGTAYVSTTRGMDAVTMMNAADYDIATLGNHEFDYGYEALRTNLDEAQFQVLCANVLDESGSPIYDANTVYETASGLKIGFFGINTPESQTKANPALIKGLTFLAGDDMYASAQDQIDELSGKSDVVIALAHLGVDDESAPNCSTDLYTNTTGIDFIIDGHSHTVMTEGENGEPIQSTGTALEYVGAIVINNVSGQIEDHDLIALKDENGSFLEGDAEVAAAAQAIIDRVDAEYGQVFASTEVALNGERAPGNRTEETNLGDLITDSMLWSVQKYEGSIKVPAENVVAITNGGGIRASIAVGDITKKDVNTVLPFGNTVAVVYVTGAELLEALEASTYCTPEAAGAFPQVSGINFTIDTTQAYDPEDETYPNSSYYGPKTINRVTIDSVNGQPFDEDATYAVVTNNFLAAGGDTYYAFASASEQFDTGIPMDEALMDYITEELEGVVGQAYAEPAGRITILLSAE